MNNVINKICYDFYSGEWYVFSGNELGALLGWWMMHTYQVSNPQANLGNAYMLASTVSSKILRAMAKKEGFNFEVCVYLCTLLCRGVVRHI